MGQLTFKSGSGYSASWEVRNTTLCAMENQVKELTSLINELYEARELLRLLHQQAVHGQSTLLLMRSV